jgi:phosphoribosylpyrophosphate synthetase
VCHWPTLPIWVEKIRSITPTIDCIISPDFGRKNAVATLGNALAIPHYCLDKSQLAFHLSMPYRLQLRGKHAFLFDDEIVTGSTLRNAIKFLHQCSVATISVGVVYALCPPSTFAHPWKVERFILSNLVPWEGIHSMEILDVISPLLKKLIHIVV